MNKTKKYILFNPSKSIYDKTFKFHKIDSNTLFISLKAIEESIEFTEKAFPGDDKDKIIVKNRVEKYFKVSNKKLEAKLKSFVNTKQTIVFIFTETKESSITELIDLQLYEEYSKVKIMDIEEFPKKNISDSAYFNLDKNLDIDFDEFW